MPIYEFYCDHCNTIYNFFSRSVNTEKLPLCPRCKTVTLRRMMSLFATISATREDAVDDDMPPLDDARMEKAMEILARDADKIDEDDPRQAIDMMRKVSKEAGLTLSEGMEEALARIEKGEDPKKVEEEMGNVFENENPFVMEGKRVKGSKRPRPAVDETLYDL